MENKDQEYLVGQYKYLKKKYENMTSSPDSDIKKTMERAFSELKIEVGVYKKILLDRGLFEDDLENKDICPKCGERVTLAKRFITEWDFDAEPYKSGKEENVVLKCGEELSYLDCEMYLAIEACPTCKYINWLSIEEAEEEIPVIFNHTKD